jgi:maltooligosyltrehalose trehalohydrolase
VTTFGSDPGFGARYLGDGRTHFRLWAPAAGRVDVQFADGRAIPLAGGDDGFFAAELPAAPGVGYRYCIDGEHLVPDPASRAQADDVHDDSVVVDPAAYVWQHPQWQGRPWQEMVVYELHVGACGGFAGVARQLGRLADLGIGAIELMPIADFAGRRNWGYDGVLPFAPDRSYGSPAQLKALVDQAHGLGLCVYLDVVYNHFGPEGNFLHRYAPQFFDSGVHTPWGAAIDFGRREVRDFFAANALYWLEEYRFDGLRFDAVHAIGDPGWLDEMAATLRAAIAPGRHLHLVLENERNAPAHLRDDRFDAQWNDDAHNALHALVTGESDGYYAHYHPDPLRHLARCLREGFAYQGEVTPGSEQARGEPSGHLPPWRFVFFLQNHDQVGNRALGERLQSLVDEPVLRAAVALQLLCPQVPLVFMGEEWGSQRPFQYFTDFHDALGAAVREGRRSEFAGFPAFADAERREQIPDPNEEATFRRSMPDFDADDPDSRRWRRLYAGLLRLRRERIVPGLVGCRSESVDACGAAALVARWTLGSGEGLVIAVNFGSDAVAATACSGELLFESSAGAGKTARLGRLVARSCAVFLVPRMRAARTPGDAA